MAESNLNDGDDNREPTGPTWKFFAAYFGGIVLAAVGIVAAVSVTSDRTGDRAADPDAASPDGKAAAPTLPRFPGRLTLDCEFSDIPHLSGDLTGWVIRRSPGKPRATQRLKVGR